MEKQPLNPYLLEPLVILVADALADLQNPRKEDHRPAPERAKTLKEALKILSEKIPDKPLTKGHHHHTMRGTDAKEN